MEETFIATYLGYSIGSAPIVGFHYGAGGHSELKNLFQKSLKLIAVWGLALVSLAFVLSSPLAKIFVGYDAELLAMAVTVLFFVRKRKVYHY